MGLLDEGGGGIRGVDQFGLIECAGVGVWATHAERCTWMYGGLLREDSRVLSRCESDDLVSRGMLVERIEGGEVLDGFECLRADGSGGTEHGDPEERWRVEIFVDHHRCVLALSLRWLDVPIDRGDLGAGELATTT